MASLYGELFKYRQRENRAPLEDYISAALVDLLNRAPSEGSRLFVEKVLFADDVPDNWKTAFGADAWYEWITQHRVSHSGAEGRVDILLRVNGESAIAIESKIYSSIRGEGDATQLHLYGKWLMREPHSFGWAGGLVFLTHGTAPPDNYLNFVGDEYGVACRRFRRWAHVADWLRSMAKCHASDASAWATLCGEMATFLAENDMAEDLITHRDISALEIFVPSASRFSATFKRIAEDVAAAKLGQPNSRGKDKAVVYDGHSGIVWDWLYLGSAPSDFYIGWGLRFPEISRWPENGADQLPLVPHAFVSITKDKGPFETKPKALLDWIGDRDHELIIGRELSKFGASPEKFVDDLSKWICANIKAANAAVNWRNPRRDILI